MKRIISLALTSAVLSAAHAEPPAPSPVIEIRGASSDTRLDDLERLGSTRVLKRPEIESMPLPSIDAFLRQVPGFSLFRRAPSTATHPTGQGVSLRGRGTSGASRSVVLLDGIPLNDPFGGWVSWSRITQSEIERIKIQPSWGSNHWSYLGLGSSIEIDSRSPRSSGSNMRVQGGEQDTYRFGSTLRGVQGRSAGSIGADVLKSGGFVSLSPKQRGSIDRAIAMESAVGFGSASLKLGEDEELRISANVFDEDRSSGTQLSGSRSRNYLLGGHYLARSLAISGFMSSGTLSSTFSAQDADRQTEAPASRQYHVPSDEAGLAAHWKHAGAMTSWEIGADALWRQGESNEEFRYAANQFQRDRSTGGEQLAGGMYAANRLDPGEHYIIDSFFRLNVYKNLDLFRLERSRGTEAFESANSTDGNLRLRAEPRLQIAKQLSKASVLKFSAAHGMRIPTINELVRPFRVRNDVTEANPNLSDEQITSYEISYDHRQETASLRVTAFFNDLRNPITNVTLDEADAARLCPSLTEGTCRQRRNVNQARTYGTEILSKVSLFPGIALDASYLLTRSEIADAGRFKALEGNDIPQLPLHQAAIGASGIYQDYSLSLRARFTGRQYEDDENSRALGSFIAFDAAAIYRLGDSWLLSLSAENLTDRRYDIGKTAEGLTTLGPGRIVLAGAQYNF